MGSGTTLVASSLMGRKYASIDKSDDMIKLAQSRLEKSVKIESNLVKKVKSSYINKTEEEMKIINSIDTLAVQSNKGIDGFLKEYY